ncbi:MAG: membrane integrity-associated transporter subunit PqiC [Rhodoferax sp.]|jgi:cholesterol transport system auxiliary component|nr:membrane integrity-associated transporter subunit PqiC [Rhodoferax sp.]MBP9059941.1 membrane integrity-associated transporter subunit PqiC [Rhodoferax sp.]MBP9685252.1 membrane integrity-associated transporter subunit PqiC [Rhodoferax sp.]
MNFAMKSIAACAYSTCGRGLFLALILTLTGCAASNRPARPVVYDFGPGSTAVPSQQAAPLPPLVIAGIDAHPSLDSTAIVYRLAYANDQQLKAYALARWSMSPAQLVRQRLREKLGERRALFNMGEGGAPGVATPLILRIQLEEFSHLFETPEQSAGLLRLRATVVTRTTLTGEKLVAQRNVLVRRPAPSADAPGGVRAMTAATDAAVQEIDQWLQELLL